jgi:hypothetical protein
MLPRSGDCVMSYLTNRDGLCIRRVDFPRVVLFDMDTKTVRALTFKLNENDESHSLIIASDVHLDIPDATKLSLWNDRVCLLI